MHSDRRSSARDKLSLPIALADGTPAVTRNISASGMFFTLPAGHQLDQWMQIEFEVPSAGLRFTAAGEVVRIEHGEGEDGVALRLHAPRLTALD
jgi:hypothetical protein